MHMNNNEEIVFNYTEVQYIVALLVQEGSYKYSVGEVYRNKKLFCINQGTNFVLEELDGEIRF